MDTVLAIALVGTARQSGATPQTGTPIDPLLAAIPPENPERGLLLAAGAVAVYQAAGRIPPTLPAPTPSSDETLPVCSPRAANVLAALFTGRHTDLLPEALTLLHRSARLLAPHLLPPALDVKAPETRNALLPVLGARGRWLATHNPAWHWVADADLSAAANLPEDAGTIWQEGTNPQRLAILTTLRKTNPIQARDWLAAVWKSEKADTRATMLDALATNLSLADEPFLEAALDDKSEKVRNKAAMLLARLPDSALSVRMRERADAMLSYETGAPRGRLHRLTQIVTGETPGGKLVVSPPETLDKAWQRDGIPLDPPQGVGQKSWWLQETISRVPPGHWVERFGADLEALIAAAQQIEELLVGWSQATLLHADTEWAGPLWDCWQSKKQPAQGRDSLRARMLQSLSALLPATEAERRLQAALAQNAQVQSDPWSILVASQSWQMSNDFSSACSKSLQEFVRTLKPGTQIYSSFWYQSLDTVARSIAPACFVQALEASDVRHLTEELAGSGAAPDWQRRQVIEALQRFAGIIHLRQRLHQELVP